MHSPRLRSLGLSLALALLLSTATARAQDLDPAAPPTDPAPATEGAPGETGGPSLTGDAEGDGGKKKKKKKGGDAADEEVAPAVTFKGRVFFRGGYFDYGDAKMPDINGDIRQRRGVKLTVPSARFGLKVKPLDWITVNLELDITGRPEMKDGFVQAKQDPFMARVGQFKMPALAIFLESPWTLPLARRGMLNEILVDQLQISGRRPGAVAQWQGGGSLDPEVTVGVFQGSGWYDGEFDAFNEETIYGQSPIGRFAITPGGVEIAAWGQLRSFNADISLPDPRRFWAAGLDVIGDHTFAASGLRYWIEAVAGQSWMDANRSDDEFTQFRAARALIAYRRGGIIEGEGFFEPYVMVGAMDPDTRELPDPMAAMPTAERGSDLIWEAKVGINLGYWKKARLILEYERTKFGDFIPAYFHDTDQFNPNPFHDSHAVLLQAGAAF